MTIERIWLGLIEIQGYVDDMEYSKSSATIRFKVQQLLDEVKGHFEGKEPPKINTNLLAAVTTCSRSLAELQDSFVVYCDQIMGVMDKLIHDSAG